MVSKLLLDTDTESWNLNLNSSWKSVYSAYISPLFHFLVRPLFWTEIERGCCDRAMVPPARSTW